LSSARPRLLGIVTALVAVVVVAGCTGSSAPAPKAPAKSATTAPITLTYAHEQEFVSYNNNTASQFAASNSAVLNQVLRGFWYAGPNGEVVPDREFGTYERVASNPLTVKYTFDPKATWSDGNPIDCDDAVLAWAAKSGRWPTGKRDRDTGLKITAFDAPRPGVWSNVRAPRCADGDRSFTVTYDTVYSDWASLFGAGTIMPAHIVEKESGVKDIIAAVKADNPRTMIKVGDVYDSLWAARPGQYKTEISPSAGPYQVSAWSAGQSLTLKPNPKWWGRPPRAATVVVKFIPQDHQVAALRSGAVQVIDPNPTPELLAQLKEPGASLKVSTHDSFTWEHLDFNATGVFRNLQLRKAFAKCVPRQQIVDNLIKPQNPDAEVLESRFLLPFQPGYQAFGDLGGQAYDKVDIAGARQILREQDKLGMRVEIGYQAPNPRRKAEVDLIRDLCGQAGFKVVDRASSTFFGSELERTDFDVALFAWTGSPLVTQGYATFLTRGANNKGRYSNPEVDQMLKQLYSELNPNNQQRLLRSLDAALWADVATIPLFAFPAVMATAPDVQNVEYNPSIDGITYNMNDWTLAR
jgi:peptide/nickel transport system substrate-binding protein